MITISRDLHVRSGFKALLLHFNTSKSVDAVIMGFEYSLILRVRLLVQQKLSNCYCSGYFLYRPLERDMSYCEKFKNGYEYKIPAYVPWIHLLLYLGFHTSYMTSPACSCDIFTQSGETVWFAESVKAPKNLYLNFYIKRYFSLHFYYV